MTAQSLAGPLTGQRLVRALLACTAVLVLGVAVAAILGPAGAHPGDLGRLLTGEPIMLHARLPRVVLGVLCGAGLALAGATLQALLQNPLADPYVVGVSGGAALGGTLMVALGTVVPWGAWGPWLLPAGALAGAVSALLLLGVVLGASAAQGSAVLLGGVVFNATCLALVAILRLTMRAETAVALGSWMLGDISSEPWPLVAATAVWVGVASVWLLFLAGPLHVLAQGESTALRLGLNTTGVRIQAYLAVSMLVAGVVSVAGMVGFVGLVVPHALRARLGADARVLLPASFMVGGALLPLLDGLARVSFLLWNTELPVGALTALLGGPLFLRVLRHGGTR
jgi:iron complex transport system permease protein